MIGQRAGGTSLGRLTLLTWPDYIAPETLSRFEQETGIPVRLEIVAGAADLVESMRRTGPSPDVLCPPDYAVRELAGEALLLALDHDRLPNLANLEPRFRLGRAHDPDGRVSVVKDWGTTGFTYRTDVEPSPLESWSDFWEAAARHPGRVTVLDSSGEVIGAALKMRGHSYNAADPAALAQAQADLLQLRPHLLAFETNYRPLLASGEAALALGWNGDAAALRDQGVPVRYVIPAEGSQVWEDDWAIAARSLHPEAAHAFLDFVLRADVAAQEAAYTRYATGNRAAWRLLDPELRRDASVYPPADVGQRLEVGLPQEAEGARRREAVWRAVRG